MARGKRSIFMVKGLVVLSLLGTAAVIWANKLGTPEDPQKEAAVPVRVLRPKSGDLRRTLSLNGSVDGSGTVTVSPKISGTLVSLLADVGDEVMSGQVLGSVDPEPFALALEQARISRDSAKDELSRATKLYEAGSASKQAYDQAKTRSESAQAQYDVAEFNYRNTRIVAPVSGTVVRRGAVKGALVSPTTPVLQVDGDQVRQVIIQVPERYIQAFMGGSVGPVALSAPYAGVHDLAASVSRVAPYVKSENRCFDVTCVVDDRNRLLLPGMFVQVTFTLQERVNVPLLPLSALVQDDELWLLDRATMRAHAVKVDSPFSDGINFQVPDQCLGDEAIVEGQQFLREGLFVSVLGESEDR